MYLKAVEIYGFKSFAEKIYIDFNRGITSIVGPNGSGKSNILDAVLWVLGEQSYKNIRAKESQDVIFSGGKEKKPMNKAEVSLFIDNEDRYMDLDNDEIKITRRIHRDGNNEYFINDIKSRLKDIGTLFLDTGIGKTAYSVIGQGKVERIINSSPREIKSIIEEAAGIKKFQANRVDCMRKLSSVEIELDKVEILINETRENKNKIEKQAEKAQEFLNIRDEKVALAKGISIAELSQKEKLLVENNEAQAISEVEVKEISDKLQKSISRLETIDLEKEEVRKEIALINSKNEELRNIISEKEKEKAVSLERLENYSKEKNSTEESILNYTKKIEQKILEFKEKEEDKERLIKNVAEMESQNTEFENKISVLEEKKKSKELLLESKNNKTRELELEKLKISNNIEVTTKRIKSSQNEIENYKKEAEETNKKIESLSVERNKNKILLDKKSEELENIIKRNEFLETELSNISRRINKLSESIRSQDYDEKRFSGKLEALVRMEENNEGFFKGVKEVLNAKIEGVEGVLISLLNFDEKYQKAIEASISGNLQDIVVRDREVAKKAISYLKERKAGRASFLALDLIKSYKREYKGSLEGVCGVASDIVQMDKKYSKVLDFVLGNILIVESIDIATKILNSGNFGGNIVTLSGELLSSRGRMTGGENQKSSISQLMARKQEIKTLTKKLETLRENIKNEAYEREKLSYKLEEYENEIDKIDLKEENCRKQLKIFQDLEEGFGDREDRLTRDRDILLINIQEEEKYAKEYENKIGSSTTAMEDIEQHLKVLAEEIKKEEKLFKESSEEIEELNKKFADVRILYLNSKDKIEQIKEELTKLEKDKEELTSDQKSSEEKLEKIKQTIISLQETEKTLAEEIEKHIKIFNTENKGIESLNEREINLNNEERALSKEKSEYESKHLHSNDKLQKLIDNSEKLKQEIQILKEDLENLEEITEVLVEIEKIKSSKDKLRSLDNKLNNFGDVNLLAVEEFKELKERYNFIATQRDDIMKARKSLLDIIQEIDETIHTNFYDTYNAINANFNKMCEETIRNTEGKLNILNEEDFDNCGVEIFVKFKNKRKQPLSLLSGGEKSMVAIAFIMAIFMYKPSPFTFLDEIEAALDEKNTKNLLSKLREFTDKSQFILITHNKDTMKESDSIFGVTMNKEIGVSKIVPVKF